MPTTKVGIFVSTISSKLIASAAFAPPGGDLFLRT
jgi:hypothetical protein